MSDVARTPAGDLIDLWRSGNDAALRDFLPLVYDELRRVARRHLAGERAEHTLQTTALIHEAYLRFVEQGNRKIQNRAHFIALSSHLMRQILVDHARERLAQKRDGGRRVTLGENVAAGDGREIDVLAIDTALSRLAHLDAQQARIVELRYFGGLSIQETSDALGISEATVKRDWATARAWLHREMKDRDSP